MRLLDKTDCIIPNRSKSGLFHQYNQGTPKVEHSCSNVRHRWFFLTFKCSDVRMFAFFEMFESWNNRMFANIRMS